MSFLQNNIRSFNVNNSVVFLVDSSSCETISIIWFQHHPPKETSYSIPLSHQPPGNHECPFCLCRFAYSEHFVSMGSYTCGLFLTGFLHSACFQGSPTLSHVSALHLFLMLNNIPLYGCITVCLPIPPLMNILIVSTSWLLWVMLLWTSSSKILCGLMFSIWGSYLGLESLDHMVTLYSEAQTSEFPSSSWFAGGDGA